MQTQDTVKAVLDRLPDDCTLEEVLYHLYVVQAVARGQADVEAGRTLSQQQVADELRRQWLVPADRYPSPASRQTPWPLRSGF